MSAMPEPLHPVARGLAAPAGSLASYPPVERWDDWEDYDAAAWPRKVERRYALVPTICFNCEAACGLLAYVDQDTGQIRKFEGNPLHPGCRGRNCAKGPATLNQINDPERILYPLRRKGARGGGEWERVTWDEVLDDIAGRIREALVEGRPKEVMYHVGPAGPRAATWTACSRPGASTATTPTRTSARRARGRATRSGWGSTARRPTTPTRGSSCSSPRTSRAGTTSTRTRSGSSRPRCAARRSASSTRGSRTRRRWRTAGSRPGRAPRRRCCSRWRSVLVDEGRYDRDFVRRWVNWEEYLREERPELPGTFEGFERALEELYAAFTPEFAEEESGVPAATIVEVAREIGRAGSALATHVWRNAAAGNLGGWQVARALEFLVVLIGAVGTPGGTAPNACNKVVPAPFMMPAARDACGTSS